MQNPGSPQPGSKRFVPSARNTNRGRGNANATAEKDANVPATSVQYTRPYMLQRQQTDRNTSVLQGDGRGNRPGELRYVQDGYHDEDLTNTATSRQCVPCEEDDDVTMNAPPSFKEAPLQNANMMSTGNAFARQSPNQHNNIFSDEYNVSSLSFPIGRKLNTHTSLLKKEELELVPRGKPMQNVANPIKKSGNVVTEWSESKIYGPLQAALISKQDVPKNMFEDLKQDILRHDTHCLSKIDEPGVVDSYIKFSLDACDHVMIAYAEKISITPQSSPNARVQVVDQNTKNILAFATLKYYGTLDALKQENGPLHDYQTAGEMNVQCTYGVPMASIHPELHGFEPQGIIYVDVLCSRLNAAGPLLSAIEEGHESFRTLLKKPYDCVALKSLIEPLTLYVGRGFIRTFDFKVVYPIYALTKKDMDTMTDEISPQASTLPPLPPLVIRKDRYVYALTTGEAKTIFKRLADYNKKIMEKIKKGEASDDTPKQALKNPVNILIHKDGHCERVRIDGAFMMKKVGVTGWKAPSTELSFYDPPPRPRSSLQPRVTRRRAAQAQAQARAQKVR